MQQQFLKKFFPSHKKKTLSKDKSSLSLKNQEKHFTNIRIGIETW